VAFTQVCWGASRKSHSLAAPHAVPRRGAARPVVREAEVGDARARQPAGQQARLVVLQQVAAEVQARQARRGRQRLRSARAAHRRQPTGLALLLQGGRNTECQCNAVVVRRQRHWF